MWLSFFRPININGDENDFENMKGLEMVVMSLSSQSPIFFFFRGADPQLSSSSGRFSVPSSLSSSSCLVTGLRRHQECAKLVGNRARGGAVQVLANPNIPSSSLPGKAKAKKVVIMVDPLEAKRLAGKQMEEIKGREKQQKSREIEAINGAWAIIGLTIGLVIEAQTGKGILAQLVGYWSAVQVLHLLIPST